MAYFCSDRIATAISVAVFLMCHCRLLATAQEQSRGVSNQPLQGLASATSYVMDVTLGAENGQVFQMLLDTGSANDAVAGSQCCQASTVTKYSCAASSSCSASDNIVTVNYASAAIQGVLVQETFSTPFLGSVPAVDLIEITVEDDFLRTGFQGILGFGYEAIAQPSGDNQASALYRELVARSVPDIFSLLLCGTLQTILQGRDTSNFNSGQLVLGGVDGPDGERFYQGDLVYTPILEERWYVLLVTDIGLNGLTFGIPCDDFNDPRAIVDSGTTNIVMPSNIYTYITAQLQAAILQAVPNFDTTYMNSEVVCCEDYCNSGSASAALLNAPSLYFTFATESDDFTQSYFSITVPAEYYFRPVQRDNQNCRIYGISEGNNLVLGNAFIDGLYVVHDRQNKRLGFGIAQNCENGVVSSKTLTPPTVIGTSWCNCLSSSQRSSATVVSYIPGTGQCFFWQWWMYIVLASLTFSFVSIMLVCCTFCKRRRRRKERRMLEHRRRAAALRRGVQGQPHYNGAYTARKMRPPPHQSRPQQHQNKPPAFEDPRRGRRQPERRPQPQRQLYRGATTGQVPAFSGPTTVGGRSTVSSYYSDADSFYSEGPRSPIGGQRRRTPDGFRI